MWKWNFSSDQNLEARISVSRVSWMRQVRKAAGSSVRKQREQGSKAASNPGINEARRKHGLKIRAESNGWRQWFEALKFRGFGGSSSKPCLASFLDKHFLTSTTQNRVFSRARFPWKMNGFAGQEMIKIQAANWKNHQTNHTRFYIYTYWLVIRYWQVTRQGFWGVAWQAIKHAGKSWRAKSMGIARLVGAPGNKNSKRNQEGGERRTSSKSKACCLNLKV